MVFKEKRKSLKKGDLVLKGRYEIREVLHVSGMANVYLVTDKNLNKQWCLKEIVKSEAGKNMVEYRSLLQEANIMKNLEHAYIPRIVSIEEDGDSIFIIMDYVYGVSIRSFLEKNGIMEQSSVVSIMKQVCGVLLYLHNRKQPIFYRDMKPDNIMIQENGNIKVLDFGISVVITSDNDVIKEPLGTRGFAAPEQGKRGLKYDLRSDIYSLGKTMYYMLTGINPGNPSVLGTDLRSVREVNSSLSVGLEVIIDKCTKKNPDERYQTVEEVLYDLKNYEKLDSSYKKKIKRKVNITAGVLISSIVLLLGSFIPFGINKSQISELYKKNLEVAYQTNRVSDFVKAISYKPLNIPAYNGMIDSIEIDGVFTKDEENDLLSLINPNLVDIKKKDGFGELAFNIGKLYWFYYEGDDGDIVSTKWFKEAIDNNYNNEEANVYYNLASFKKDISMSITESSDSGMYIKYWENLIKAKDIDNGDVTELQIYNSIADAISIYPYRLKQDGVSKGDIIKELESINTFISIYNPISDKSKELFNTLKSKYPELQNKVDIAYSTKGED